MKLILVVINYKQSIALIENLDLPILIYKNNGRLILISEGKNPDYFTLLFSNLFLMGNRV